MKKVLFICFLHLFNFVMLSAKQNDEVESISSYIKANYDILYQSPWVENLDDVYFYLLVEQHDLIGHKQVNSELISQYAQKNDFVFVEGVPEWHKIAANTSLQSMWITAPVTIMGWDAGWMKDITGIDLTKMEQRGIELLQIQHDMAWNKDLDKKAEYYAIISELVPFMEQYQVLLSKDFEKKIQETFPKRVEAMRRTLSRVFLHQLGQAALGGIKSVLNEKELAKDYRIPISKTFLIAGLYHLWQDKSQSFFKDPSTSLDSLYELINKTKTVVLIPKQDVTEHWGHFYQVVP